MAEETIAEKVARFEQALNQLIDRLAEDRYVLAAVLVGSLSEGTIWDREWIGLWVIEADGVSRRLRSDGKDERIFRILVEDSINIWAEVIPRTRFKQMVEGSSRTAFSCNFFAKRQLVHSKDPSIDKWFDQANTGPATALNLILQAGAGSVFVERIVTVPQPKQLLQNVDTFPDRAC